MNNTAETREFTLHTDDGARLAVTVIGRREASTVVLAHGWGASRRVWGTVAERLVADGHTVVCYDQRGHGASTQGQEPISIRRFGEDLGEVLSYVDALDAIVAGHSGGGFAAMAYATSVPDEATKRLKGMALLATAAHDQDTSNGEVRMMGSAVFSWALARPWLGRRLLGQTMGKRPDPVALELNRQLFAATPAQVRADCFRCSRGMDLRGGLASVTIPAVVLAGAADTVIDPKLGRAVAEAMPRARFEQLEGAGHMLPLEAPGRVVSAISELAKA